MYASHGEQVQQVQDERRGRACAPPSMARFARAGAAALALGLATACGGGSAPPDTGFDPQQPPTSSPAMTLISEAGTWTVAMWAYPQPARRGPADILFAVSDGAGVPVDGLTVETQPWMPAHGHGASTPPAVAPLGAGRYWAMPINFYMPGRWELRTTLAGEVTDRVVFVLDVP